MWREGGNREMNDHDYRKLIHNAGGVFLGVRGDVVLFRDDVSKPVVVSLYLTACRSEEDVRLALKASREELPVR